MPVSILRPLNRPVLAPQQGPAPVVGRVLPKPTPTMGDRFENTMFGGLDLTLRGLNGLGVVRPGLNRVLRLAAPGNDDQWYKAMADHAGIMLEAEYSERSTRKSYDKCAQDYLETANAIAGEGVELTEPTAFHNADFIKELEEAGDACFSAGNRVEYLFDGPASFAKRADLIDGAQESIHLLTWAIYDDPTGKDLCKRLVAKALSGIDVRVVIDRNIADRSAHIETLKYLEDNGVKVIRWEDSERVQWGNHCKVMLVDGVHAVAGGMNPGDYYSHGWHANPEYDGDKWRDTDIYTHGPSAVDQECLFARYWNSQVQMHNLGLDFVTVDKPKLMERAGQPGNSKVALVEHLPGDSRYDVYSTMLKAVSGATKTIEIENAYFLTLPGMNELLHAALMRGVDVRIYTNSDKSVDEPLVSEPIMKSLPELHEAGAKIFLKKGSTLHSKFMVVDDTFASVGSLNLHPRSLYYDSEMALNILDEESAVELRQQFDADITEDKAIEVKSLEDLFVESAWYNRFIRKNFYRHL